MLHISRNDKCTFTLLKADMQKKRLASELPPDVLEKICLYLNPCLLSKDYKSLAAKMGMSLLFVSNIERMQNPTEYLLHYWWTKNTSGTVSDLIKLVKKIKRDDVKCLLEHYEYIYHGDSRTNGTVVHTQNQRSRIVKKNDSKDCDTDEESDQLLTLHMQRFPNENEDLNQETYDTDDELERKLEKKIKAEYNVGKTQHHHLHPKYQYLDSGSEVRSQWCADQQQSQHSVKAACHQFSDIGMPTPGNTAPTKYSMIQPCTKMISRKVALLIGNQNYQNLSGDDMQLLYPHKDVQDFARALEKLEFDVRRYFDLNLQEMKNAVLTFKDQLGPTVYGLCYYGGHSYEVDKVSYLMPVDSTSFSNTGECISSDDLILLMQKQMSLFNIFIMDGCRDRRSEKQRSVTKKLTGNTVVAYSCQRNMPAFDLTGEQNGIYMTELLKRISENRRIEHILMDVAEAVSQNKFVHQRPCFESDACQGYRLTDPILVVNEKPGY